MIRMYYAGVCAGVHMILCPVVVFILHCGWTKKSAHMTRASPVSQPTQKSTKIWRLSG